MPDTIKISELNEALALADAAEFPYTQENGGENTTFKAPLTQIAAKIVEDMSYAGINLPTGAGVKSVENTLNYLLGAVGGDPNGNISDSYDPAAAYVKGDLCIYENALYICTAPTTGDFDPSKWTATTIDNVIGSLTTLTTTVQSSLVGAINEIATYTPVYGNTASGAIATFDTSLALPLQDCTIAINAVQEAGTPTPSSPKAISGFTGANVVNCSDNLVTGMTTSTADGITTSYDNTTGLISIENNSRTTNYATGSSRNAVASNLDTSHTYKYKFIPEITGVIATDAAGVGLPLNEEFTGVASVKLRVTSAYDFVSTHPIGDITTTRLVIVDVTEGGKITTHPVSWNDEAGTVSEGSLNVTTGKLTVVNGSMGAGEYQLTPIPINQLSGTNNIFCDTGNTSVMFACSLKDYIDSQ